MDGRVHPMLSGSRPPSLPSHDVEPVTAMNRGMKEWVRWAERERERGMPDGEMVIAK